jgi:hypothetical protein
MYLLIVFQMQREIMVIWSRPDNPVVRLPGLLPGVVSRLLIFLDKDLFFHIQHYLDGISSSFCCEPEGVDCI